MPLIHELLDLTRPLVVPDVETTGLDTQTARIVELGFQVFTAEGLTRSYRSLIHPGIKIPAETTAVHHITDADVENCQTCKRPQDEHFDGEPASHGGACAHFRAAPRFFQLAQNLANGFSNCDFAGKNVRFDLRILSAEFARASVNWSYTEARIIDAEQLERIAVPRTLSHLYEKYTGLKLDDAHQAAADVQATVDVIVGQLTTHQGVFPRDLRALHELQWPGWIDSDGKFRFDKDGVACCNFGKHNGVKMKDVPRDYYKWLTQADFSHEVKQIAGAALSGKFPEKRP